MCQWEDDERYNATIASDNPKYHAVDWVFGFYQQEYEFVPRLTSKTLEIFVLEPLCEFQTVSHFWGREQRQGTAFLTDSASLTLVCCAEAKKKKKKTARAKLII